MKQKYYSTSCWTIFFYTIANNMVCKICLCFGSLWGQMFGSKSWTGTDMGRVRTKHLRIHYPQPKCWGLMQTFKGFSFCMVLVEQTTFFKLGNSGFCHETSICRRDWVTMQRCAAVVILLQFFNLMQFLCLLLLQCWTCVLGHPPQVWNFSGIPVASQMWNHRSNAGILRWGSLPPATWHLCPSGQSTVATHVCEASAILWESCVSGNFLSYQKCSSTKVVSFPALFSPQNTHGFHTVATCWGWSGFIPGQVEGFQRDAAATGTWHWRQKND